MKLKDLEFIRLLPMWMRGDLANISLSRSLDELIKSFAYRIPTLTEHLDFENMTDEEIDEIAWERNIPWYNDSLTREQKIELIRYERLIKERKGTIWSVLKIIDITIGSAYVQEWWEYGGNPAGFIIYTDIENMDDEKYALMIDLINQTKPARSWLEGVYYYKNTTAEIDFLKSSEAYVYEFIQCGTVNGVGTIGTSYAAVIEMTAEGEAYKYSFVQCGDAECGTVNEIGTLGTSSGTSVKMASESGACSYAFVQCGAYECGELSA